jgi:hypothetical protein
MWKVKFTLVCWYLGHNSTVQDLGSVAYESYQEKYTFSSKIRVHMAQIEHMKDCSKGFNAEIVLRFEFNPAKVPKFQYDGTQEFPGDGEKTYCTFPAAW